jgi:hypothetical protein
MNLKLYAKIGAAVILGALLLSWWLGCWGRWRAENPTPPPIPPRIDPGEVVTPEAPVVDTPLVAPVQQLSKAELVAWAKRYGLTLVPRQVPVPAPSTPAPGPEPATETVLYPLRLAEERFCQAPGTDGDCPETSPSVDVTAIQSGPGLPVDLVAAWRELEPEPCPESRVFAAPGKFRTFIGVGAIGGSVTDDAGERVTFADPAALVGGTFEGIRVGPVTLGGMGLAGVSQGGDVAGAVGIGISW